MVLDLEGNYCFLENDTFFTEPYDLGGKGDW